MTRTAPSRSSSSGAGPASGPGGPPGGGGRWLLGTAVLAAVGAVLLAGWSLAGGRSGGSRRAAAERVPSTHPSPEGRAAAGSRGTSRSGAAQTATGSAAGPGAGHGDQVDRAFAEGMLDLGQMLQDDLDRCLGYPPGFREGWVLAVRLVPAGDRDPRLRIDDVRPEARPTANVPDAVTRCLNELEGRDTPLRHPAADDPLANNQPLERRLTVFVAAAAGTWDGR